MWKKYLEGFDLVLNPLSAICQQHVNTEPAYEDSVTAEGGQSIPVITIVLAVGTTLYVL